MRRTLIGWSILGGLCALFAIALMAVGYNYDNVRLERDELEQDVEDLEADQESWWEERDTLASERDAVKAERDTLAAQADQHLKTIETLKAELDQARRNAPASTP